MKLTTEQFNTILDGHVQRVIENMDYETLMQYAHDGIRSSFLDSTDNRDKFSDEALFMDMLNHECGDSDSVYEFLIGTGVVSENEAEEWIEENE